MSCVICRKGKLNPGAATVTLERKGATVVFKNVPAEICSNCGEEYLDEKTTGSLLKTAEEAAKSGVYVDIREYKAA